jgi:hypothetical protein
MSTPFFTCSMARKCGTIDFPVKTACLHGSTLVVARSRPQFPIKLVSTPVLGSDAGASTGVDGSGVLVACESDGAQPVDDDNVAPHTVDGPDALSGDGDHVTDNLGATTGGAIGDDNSSANVLFASGKDGSKGGVLDGMQSVALLGMGGSGWSSPDGGDIVASAKFAWANRARVQHEEGNRSRSGAGTG